MSPNLNCSFGWTPKRSGRLRCVSKPMWRIVRVNDSESETESKRRCQDVEDVFVLSLCYCVGGFFFHLVRGLHSLPHQCANLPEQSR